MNYFNEKSILINDLKKFTCNLLRDGDDLDFGLLDNSYKEEVFKYFIKKKYICTFYDDNKMNFKKFIDSKIIDVDVEISTKFLKQFFYDIDIKKDFENEYFINPKKNQIAMKTVRYTMLFRGRNKKYRDFFYENREEIIKNHFFLDKLTSSPFKYNIDFDTFIKIVSVDKVAIIKNVKLKYILHFIWRKIKILLFLYRGKIVSIDGVDGAGKSTIIEILTTQLNKPSIYMGERGFMFEKFYAKKKLVFLKPLSLCLQYFEKFYRYFKALRLSRRNSLVFCDRYHRYSKSATSNSLIDLCNKLFFSIYPRPDVDIVLWNTPEIILNRKQEVTVQYIEQINNNLNYFYPEADFIKNDLIDETLNQILFICYRDLQHYV